MSRILVVDDDPLALRALSGLLRDGGHEVLGAGSAVQALDAARDEPVDLALVDLRLGAESGLDLVGPLKGIRPEMSVVVVTALGSIEVAVEAMQRGADNFLTKPVDPPRLLAVVAKACEAGELRRTRDQLVRLSARDSRPLSGRSDVMRRAADLAQAVASRDTTVLLLGETGAGKGVLARRIHELSARRAQPFVELNCAGLQRELTESELFGHERGAFTGATERKLGLFEAARGGTLFLDEIGEMELPVQAKLLQVLERRRFRRVGGLTEIAADVRLIAATHRDLEALSRDGRFREDLYFRLNVFTIRVPPLRERASDIVPIAVRFVREFRGALVPEEDAFTAEAREALLRYPWPGNVRELRNVIERAVILAPPGAPIARDDLPAFDAAPRPAARADSEPTPARLSDLERTAVEDALRAHGGNVRATARELGISRPTLYRKMKKYGIGAESEADEPD